AGAGADGPRAAPSGAVRRRVGRNAPHPRARALTAAEARPAQRSLVAFGAVSFAYFAYTGLFNAYAPLWFGHLGYSTFAIGVLAAVQSATRVLSPYAWGWLRGLPAPQR